MSDKFFIEHCKEELKNLARMKIVLKAMLSAVQSEIVKYEIEEMHLKNSMPDLGASQENGSDEDDDVGMKEIDDAATINQKCLELSANPNTNNDEEFESEED